MHQPMHCNPSAPPNLAGEPAEPVACTAPTPSPAAAYPSSVWVTAQQPARLQRNGRYLPASNKHPGKMLPAIAAHAITAYTTPGELVIDPMCGTGTTLVEAVHLGRDAIGIEYEQTWADLATANLAYATDHGATGQGWAVCGDARDAIDVLGTQLPQLGVPAQRWLGQAALVLTSPPYGASTHGHIVSTRDTGRRGVAKRNTHYSHDRDNLAYSGLDTLLAGFTTILRRCALLLRPGGHVAITVRPYRVRGELIDLPTAVIPAASGPDSSSLNAASPCSPGSATGSSSPAPASSR